MSATEAANANALNGPSVRLTNFHRDSIENAAIKARFDPLKAEQDAVEDRLGRKLYEQCIPAAERKLADKMPKHWLRFDSCLRFNVGGMDVVLHLAGDGVCVPYQDRQGNRGGGYCHRIGVIADGASVDEVRAHLAATEKLKEERRHAARSLRAMLNSVTTLKGLQSVWPEGAPFWSQIAVKTGSPGLPAPQISELNVLLGLAEAA